MEGEEGVISAGGLLLLSLGAAEKDSVMHKRKAIANFRSIQFLRCQYEQLYSQPCGMSLYDLPVKTAWSFFDIHKYTKAMTKRYTSPKRGSAL